MQSFPQINYPPTVILRHRKENLKKCSLTGLENRDDMLFYRYPTDQLPLLTDYVLLAIDAPPLTSEDQANGLLLIDATWRYAEKMVQFAESRQSFIKRSLPNHYRTAYPRKQDDCPFPEFGLASIEALFAAYRILGRSTEGLLDHYHWKDQFLKNLRETI
jgi:pre-rRNA-processing protein TSR3